MTVVLSYVKQQAASALIQVKCITKEGGSIHKIYSGKDRLKKLMEMEASSDGFQSCSNLISLSLSLSKGAYGTASLQMELFSSTQLGALSEQTDPAVA